MVTDDSRTESTGPQTTLADLCLHWPEGTHRPCYQPATLVLTRPSGQTVGFSCPDHREAWAGRIHGAYVVLGRAEWEQQGNGYRGVELCG